ncbi:Ig-like domain-containing protein [Paraglaciecola sp. Hal342]
MVAPDNSNDATPTITGNTNEPENATVSILVTDAQGVEQTLSATVQSDGSFSVDVPSDLAQGNYTVQASITDAAGNSTTESDTGSIDTVAPSLTVEAPDNSSDATPTITGTTDEPDNAIVSITVTGNNGVVQTFDTTVMDNAFSVDVPSDLVDGNYTVSATITDASGNSTTESDTGSVDTVAPGISVDAPDNSSDATPSITGTTSTAPVGATVTITVTGSDSVVQNLTATVQPDGSFHVDVPVALEEGSYTVEATVADAAGNTATDSDTGSVDTQAPTLSIVAPDNSNDATPTITGSTDEPENATVSILVTDAQGVEQTLSATVQSDGSFSVDVPNDLAQGNYTVQASITDTAGNSTTESDTGSIDTVAPSLTVEAPDNSSDATPTITGTTNEPDNAIVSITVTGSNGVVQTFDTTVMDNAFSVDVPSDLVDGNYTVSATITDASGNSTTESDTGSVDTVAPSISVDAPDNSSDATPSITGTTSTAPVGATVTITVTGSDSAVQNLTATVQPDGSFHVDVPVALEEGSYTVEATVADAAGNTATDSDTGSVDTQAPTLSIVAPDNSNDATPTITGNTNEPENATVSILVTDAQGVEQTLSATVQSDGSFSVDVPSDLAQGNYTVQASITDAAGNSTTESDTGSIDTVAPSLTVEAPDNSSDATPTITGTTDEPDNAIVSITVTGNNGVVQTFDTTVMDNAFSVDVPSDLVDGNYTVSATITDASGNSTTESDTGSVDTVAPSISVDAPDNSSDATPSITGTTSTAPVGATVTITVTGSDSAVQNLTATVQPDGSFHVDVPVALEEGSYTVEATVADAAGNTATDSDTGSVDTQAPTLTIVAPDNSNDATPTITGNTDEPENATVSILVTDSQGVEQTLSATVQSDGSFSVDVPNDLAQGNYTVQASITDAAGNSTTESDTGSVDTEGPTIALTVVGEVESGFPILSGTCSEPEGTVITVVITDSNNVEFSLSAQVDIDGLFTVVIPATAADGDASAVISVTDLAGNETVLNATVPIDLTDPVITLDKLGDIDVSANLPSITGTCSEPEGTVISVTLIDSEANEFNLTTTVGVGGSLLCLFLELLHKGKQVLK